MVATIENQIYTQNFAIFVAIIGFLGSVAWLATEIWFLKLGNGYVIYPVMSLAAHIYIFIAIYKKDIKKFGCALGFLILCVVYGITNIFFVPLFNPIWDATTESYIGWYIIVVGTEYSFFAAIVVFQVIQSNENQYNHAIGFMKEKRDNDNNSETASMKKEESEKSFSSDV